MSKPAPRPVSIALLLFFSVASTPRAETAWTGTPIEGGRVMQMHWDPSQPNTLWALAQSSGIFRSVDLGLTWESRSTGLPRAPSRFVVTDDGTLYAGTFSTGVTRIFRSADEGGSWTEILGPSLEGFRDIAVLPGNPNVLLFNAFDGNGLWRSPDGGASWSEVTAGVPSFPRAPVCQPGSSTLCLLGGATANGVFKSTDAGLSWTASSTGLPAGLKVFAIDFDPAVPSTVYVTSSSSSEVYKSIDSGDSWVPAEKGLPADFDVIRDLAVVRGAPGRLFALVEVADDNMLLYASANGGADWTQVHDFQAVGFRALASVDDGGSGVVVAATPRSVLRSSDDGASFVEANSGLVAQNISRVVAKRFNPSSLYAAAFFAGPFVSTDGGTSWLEENDGMPAAGVQDWALAQSSQDENVVAAFQFPELYLTTDGGANWTSIIADTGPFGDCGIDVYTLAFAPSEPDLWAGNFGCQDGPDFGSPEILRSVDNGANWTPLFELPPSKSFDFSLPWGRIEVHPTDPNIVLESSYVIPGAAERFWAIRRTTDHGASWTDVLTSPNGWAWLAMASGDPSRVYAGADGTETFGGVTDVFRSDDTGQTWAPLGTGLECISALAVDYEDADTVYLGCFDLYVSVDAGLTWEAQGTNGLPDPPQFNWLEVVELDGVKSLLAGTNTGIYTYPLNALFEDGFESGDTSAWSATVP